MEIEQKLLESLRYQLEPKWRDYQKRNLFADTLLPKIPSEGVCEPTTLFLYYYFKKHSIILNIKGGYLKVRNSENVQYYWKNKNKLIDPMNKLIYEKTSNKKLNKDFYYNGKTLWGKHFWLEKDGNIIDMTVDQFGWNNSYCCLPNDRYITCKKYSGLRNIMFYKNISLHWLDCVS